jgi:hypothetical protein
MLSTRRRENHFSDEMWSDEAIHYQVSIESLSETSWELIIDGAWQIAQDKPAGRTAGIGRYSGIRLPELDERELLVEGVEDVEDDEEMDWDKVPVETCEF